MSKLFLSSDERLRNVIVKGDMIITESQRNSESARSILDLKLNRSHYDEIENEEQ